MSYYADNANTVMPVVPMGSSGYNGNSSFGWGGDGSFWIIILFLFAMFNGGWGGFGFGNGGGAVPYMMNNNTNNDIQRSFDQQAVMSGIGDLNAAVTSGFGNVQTALCSGFGGVNANLATGFAGVNAGIANGFAQSEIAANSRQMANMNQLYGIQSGITNQMNTIAMNQQNGVCENRAAVADLKYTVATEGCNDRAAVDSALRDVTAQGVANTTALMNTINGGIQSIKDQLCQYRDDQKNETIANLRQQIAMKDLAASQATQNAMINQRFSDQNLMMSQGFSQEVDNLYNRLNSCPVPTTPVYGRTPIFTCGGNGNPGCGCGM